MEVGEGDTHDFGGLPKEIFEVFDDGLHDSAIFGGIKEEPTVVIDNQKAKFIILESFDDRINSFI